MSNQVSDRLHIDGRWPSPIVIRRTWARAGARPWNDVIPNPYIRLERGGFSFLRDAAVLLADMTGADVLSPALYRSAARIWLKAGFTGHTELAIMERSLSTGRVNPGIPVDLNPEPDMGALARVDARCFQGFWRMDIHGLVEAFEATPTSTSLAVTDDRGALVGYALVGIQAATAFLQRIAVIPEMRSRGLGTALLQQALRWAGQRSAQVMVLNVQHRNDAAKGLYQKAGFTSTGKVLQVLSFPA